MEAQYGIVVKWLSQQTFNLPIPSSSLGGSTIFEHISKMAFNHLFNPCKATRLWEQSTRSKSGFASMLKYGMPR